MVKIAHPSLLMENYSVDWSKLPRASIDREFYLAAVFSLAAAKIRFNKQNTIEIENFGIYPAQLVGVRRQE